MQTRSRTGRTEAGESGKLDDSSLVRGPLLRTERVVQLSADKTNAKNIVSRQSSESGEDDNDSVYSSNKSECDVQSNEDKYERSPNTSKYYNSTLSEDRNKVTPTPGILTKEKDRNKVTPTPGILTKEKGIKNTSVVVKSKVTVHSLQHSKTQYESIPFSDEEEEENKYRLQQKKEKDEVTKNISGQTLQSSNKNKGKPQYYCFPIVVSFFVVVVVAVALWHVTPKNPDSHKVVDKLQAFKDFHDGFRKLPLRFTSQSQELWSRSQRILELHLRNGKENPQPAIILLTAAQDTEHILHCVSNQLAKTYASSLNSNYTVISGPDSKSQDSEEAKLDIDNRLSAGFQASTRAAVLHRLELLPPGSLLILYKYCDHENAAFKNVALVLTVLLEDLTLAPDIPLTDLEEKVRDFLNKKFLVSKPRKSHDEMDVDKLSGLWSRISHVVLPVLPEKHIGKQCEETETKA